MVSRKSVTPRVKPVAKPPVASTTKTTGRKFPGLLPQPAGNPGVEVNKFHIGDDVDTTIRAHHHTLGWTKTQAAPGSKAFSYLELLRERYIRLSQTAGLSIPNNTLTTVTGWATDEETAVTDGFLSGPSGGQMTVKIAGIYVVTALLTYTGNATGIRQNNIIINGSLVRRAQEPAGSANTISIGQISWRGKLAVGDVIGVQADQNSGAALTLVTTGGFNYFDVEYRGPGKAFT